MWFNILILQIIGYFGRLPTTNSRGRTRRLCWWVCGLNYHFDFKLKHFSISFNQNQSKHHIWKAPVIHADLVAQVAHAANQAVHAANFRQVVDHPVVIHLVNEENGQRVNIVNKGKLEIFQRGRISIISNVILFLNRNNYLKTD